MKTILVTGVAGFIGSYTTRALLSKGYNVIGIDNFDPMYDRKSKDFNLDLIRIHNRLSPEKFNLEELEPVYSKLNTSGKVKEKASEFTFIETDIRDFERIEDLFASHEIDGIIHLAAMGGVRKSIEEPMKYTAVNIDGTVNLLELAKRHNVKKFIFASSSSVYGETKETPFRENMELNRPLSPYAATKRMCELMCYTYNHLYNIDIACLRFFTVYGPLQRPFEMAIQKFIKLVHNNRPMTIFGDGSMARDFTYIDDIVDGIISALEKHTGYSIYNLGNKHPVTLNELAETIKKIMGKGEIDYLDKPATEVPITYADISHSKAVLGYNPSISIIDGIKVQADVFILMPEWYKSL